MRELQSHPSHPVTSLCCRRPMFVSFLLIEIADKTLDKYVSLHQAVPINCLSMARYKLLREAFKFLGKRALNVIRPWACLGPVWTEGTCGLRWQACPWEQLRF